jgi:acyl-[acyl carrier protein]--UDP-N-acetylglucosamine O-acyltransferase
MIKTRVSGEVSTSLGNTLLNILVWKWIAHKLKLGDNDIIAEGDDSLIGLNE